MTPPDGTGDPRNDPPPQRQCPVCRRNADPDYAPFCSRRCRDVDLLRWLDGSYRIPDRPGWPSEEDES